MRIIAKSFYDEER